MMKMENEIISEPRFQNHAINAIENVNKTVPQAKLVSDWFRRFYGHGPDETLWNPWMSNKKQKPALPVIIDVTFEEDAPRIDHSMNYERLIFAVMNNANGDHRFLVVNKAIARGIAKFQENYGSVIGKSATVQEHKITFH